MRPRLPHRGQRLALRQVCRARGQPQAQHAHADRAAADEHHAVPLRAQVAHGSQMRARLLRFRLPASGRTRLDVPTLITCGQRGCVHWPGSHTHLQ